MEAVPREFDWLIKHPEIEDEYWGEYIAIVGERVVAHGTDFEAVLTEGERFGQEPLIHKVMPRDKAVIL